MQSNKIIWIVLAVIVIVLAIWGFASMDGGDVDPEIGDGSDGENEDGENDGGEVEDLIDDNLIDEEDDVDLGSLI